MKSKANTLKKNKDNKVKQAYHPYQYVLLLSLLLVVVLVLGKYTKNSSTYELPMPTTKLQVIPSSTPGKEYVPSLHGETVNVPEVIGKTLDSMPPEWRNASVTGIQYGDLIKVCVDDPSKPNGCDYFEYWTNKTGVWTLLGRDLAGTEGRNYCEYFEEWQIAKGMECREWNKSTSKWEIRTVSF